MSDYFDHLFIAELFTVNGIFYICGLQQQQQQQQQPFYGPLSGTTRVSRYQKKHSRTHPDHHPIFIRFFHIPRSIASSLFKLRALQSFYTTSFHVLFGGHGNLLVWSPPPHISYISSPGTKKRKTAESSPLTMYSRGAP